MCARLRDDLTVALKARERVAVAALRSALAAIANAEAVPVDHPLDSVTLDSAAGNEHVAGHEHFTGNEHVAGAAIGVGSAEAELRHLTGANVRAVVENEVRERWVAAQEYEHLGRTDLAGRLRSEAEVLSRT